MSKQQDALRLALEALENAQANVGEWWPEAITAIREALADIGNPITEQLAIPTVITCPFCAGEHVPGWLHDLNMDRGAYGEQPAIKQDLTPEQPAQQGCMRCNTPKKCALYGCSPLTWPAEQPAQQQEPVYFCDYGCEGWGKVDADMAAANIADGMTVEVYYTSPPTLSLAQRQRSVKPLTDDEIWREYRFLWPFHPAEERRLASDILMFARAIEAKLKEKNNG